MLSTCSQQCSHVCGWIQVHKRADKHCLGVYALSNNLSHGKAMRDSRNHSVLGTLGKWTRFSVVEYWSTPFRVGVRWTPDGRDLVSSWHLTCLHQHSDLVDVGTDQCIFETRTVSLQNTVLRIRTVHSPILYISTPHFIQNRDTNHQLNWVSRRLQICC